MATTARSQAPTAAGGDGWYAVSPGRRRGAARRRSVVGLSSRRPPSFWPSTVRTRCRRSSRRRAGGGSLEQYRSYMQIILVAAAIVSLAIKEWSTGVLLVLITVLNAVVGLRQEGKARERDERAQGDGQGDRARAPRRVRGARSRPRRSWSATWSLLAAGDDVPADGRIIAGERAADRRVRADRRERAGVEGGDGARRRRPRARRPDRHGVHAHAGHARQRRDARHRDGRRHAGRARSPACSRRPSASRRR